MKNAKKYFQNYFISLLISLGICFTLKYFYNFDDLTGIHIIVMTLWLFIFQIIYPFPLKKKSKDSSKNSMKYLKN